MVAQLENRIAVDKAINDWVFILYFLFFVGVTEGILMMHSEIGELRVLSASADFGCHRPSR